MAFRESIPEAVTSDKKKGLLKGQESESGAPSLPHWQSVSSVVGFQSTLLFPYCHAAQQPKSSCSSSCLNLTFFSFSKVIFTLQDSKIIRFSQRMVILRLSWNIFPSPMLFWKSLCMPLEFKTLETSVPCQAPSRSSYHQQHLVPSTSTSTQHLVSSTRSIISTSF